MTRYMKLLALIGVVVFFSACASGVKSDSEKIAVINWEKAVQGHPENPRVLQGEKIVKSLVIRRDAQKELAKSQWNSLARLRALKQISEKSYYEAELHTELMAKDQINKAKLSKRAELVEKEVEEEFLSMRKYLEDAYRLQIFNLRMKKDRASQSVRPSERAKLPETLAAIDKEIEALKEEREARLSELELSKEAMVNERLEPYAKELYAERLKYAKDKSLANQEQLLKQEGKYDKMLAIAPEALNNALAIMDKEIEKQQDKNAALKKQINKDIEEIAISLAKKRGYTIVFNSFKANVSAEDITNDIVTELKNRKK